MASSKRDSTAVAKSPRRFGSSGLLLGLLLAYAVGAVCPGPGLALREWQWPTTAGGSAPPVRFSLVMVAVILFSGAVSAAGASRDFLRRPGAIAVALAGVWVPPLVIAALGLWLAGASGAFAEVALGLAYVAAMPVANSAVGWTQQSRGSVPWALGLVVLSIAAAPWLAPWSLAALGSVAPASDPGAAREVVDRFAGWVFIAWVLAPTALGLGVRWLLGAGRVGAMRGVLAGVSIGAIVLLNYANASAALPALLRSEEVRAALVALGAATLLPVIGALCGWHAARSVALPRAASVAWAYALGMKNTGLALGLLDATAGERPLAVLVILLSTLTQHAVAAATHGLTSRGAADTESAA
jgi:predicted Na+-dependent transporter